MNGKCAHIHVLKDRLQLWALCGYSSKPDGVVTQLTDIISTLVWLSVSNGTRPTPIGYDCRDMIKNTQTMQ